MATLPARGREGSLAEAHVAKSRSSHPSAPLAPVERTDVEFAGEDGTLLAGWLYIPRSAGLPLPAITMAPGFGCTRWHGTDLFAQAFAAAGFAVLLHDHRNFGTSGGADRGDANPWQQIADWGAALSFLRDREEVDGERLGIWGDGYAGGHALVLAATDRRIHAVVSQTPAVGGLGRAVSDRVRVAGDPTDELFREDCRLRLAGDAGLRLPLASAEPAALAPFRSAAALSFYHQAGAAHVWDNEITVRSLRTSLTYVPDAWLGRVAPTPLMLVGTLDLEGRAAGARGAGHLAHGGAEVVGLTGGRFSPFKECFAEASTAAIQWFRHHL